ncbi:Retrovirus-related Pol polyprotein from transposon TNT 1-94 [Linum perenne]
MSMMINSVDPTIALTFRSYTTAAEIWSHLAKTYSQVSTSRLFDLEYALSNLSQGDLDIEAYHLAASSLWTELDLIPLVSTISATASTEILRERKRTRTLHFLMRLRPEYEQTRAQLLAKDTMDIETILAELYRTETRLQTQAKLDTAKVGSGPVFSAGQLTSSLDEYSSTEAYAVHRTRPQFGIDSGSKPLISQSVCRFCNDAGHAMNHCRKRNFCNYCKKPGHIILDCRLRRARHGNDRGNSYGARGTSYGDRGNSYGDRVTNQGSNYGHSTTPTAYMTSSSSNMPNSNDTASMDHLVQAALQRVLPSALTAAFSSVGISGNSTPWFIDSASFNHMSRHRGLFTSYKPVTNLTIEVANGHKLPVAGIGTTVTPTITLPNTLHVPKLVPNLVSVSQLIDSGCLLSFTADGCIIQDRMTKTRIGTGSKRGRVFLLDGLQANSAAPGYSSSLGHCYSVESSSNKWMLWHNRLGHPHSARLSYMFRHKLLPDDCVIKDSIIPVCEHCIEAKTHALPFGNSTTEISDPFHLIHTDLWGPAPVTSRLGFRYFALFIDHHTRFTWIYFLRHKSDLLAAAKEFVAMIHTQFGSTIKTFRSDPGGEFTSHALHEFYRSHGILYQQSCPGVSEQNGLVERKHRHILELTRALLLQTAVPSHFWVEAVRSVVYLINRQPTPVLQHSSPFEALYHRRPDYTRLRTFGCVCFVLLPRKDRTKLTSKTARCVFLGYTDHHKGYLCYDVVHHRVHIGYHVVFLENLYYFRASTPAATSPSTRLPNFDDQEGDDVVLDDITVPPSPSAGGQQHSPPLIPDSVEPLIPLRRSIRTTQGQPPPRFSDYITYSTTAVSVPSTFKQASGQPEWEEAMAVELQALHDNSTWDLVLRPSHAPVIGSKWVYTAKFHPDGSLDRYKARLVAQGFRQEFGIDYEETFAPVAKMSTVRILIALAAQQSWPLFQLDVKNAFLHGTLKETVYMECPPGYNKNSQDVVCLLRRSLYGLKQAPRAWFETFQKTILSSGFIQSRSDPSLFTKTTTRGIAILLLYVDDMILTGTDGICLTELIYSIANQPLPLWSQI